MDEALDDRGARREKMRPGEYVLIAVFAVITIIFVMPLVVMILSAFKPLEEVLRTPPTFLPEAPTLDNFKRVLTEAPYFLWYRNSLVVAIAVTAFAVCTSAVAGYICAKFELQRCRLSVLCNERLFVLNDSAVARMSKQRCARSSMSSEWSSRQMLVDLLFDCC